MRAIGLFLALLRKALVLQRRYALDTAAGALGIYVTFLIFFVGGQASSARGTAFGEHLDGLVVAFSLWSLALGALGQVAIATAQEATQGTLEQLAISPFGLSCVFLFRVAAELAFEIALVFLLLALMMGTTGKWLNLPLPSVLPLLLLVALSAEGLGFLLGGVALLYKKIHSLLMMMQFALLALLYMPDRHIAWAQYLPIVLPAHLLRQVMMNEGGSDAISIDAVMAATIVALIYFTLGIVAFRLLEQAARTRGLLAHY